ncbi:MAG: putative metal-dependent hydrolase [Candidatus Nanohaloarchaea archaeon]|jgi:predicted metal-dependent hydrolase
MKDKIREFLQIRESSRTRKVRLKYRKGDFTIVKPENTKVDVDKIIENNFDWFRTHVEEAQIYRDKIPDRSFEEDAYISILGDQKQLVIESRRSNSVGEEIYLAEHLVDRNGVKEELQKTLRNYARNVVHEHLGMYAPLIDGSYNKVFIRDQDTRWGSCSSKGNLNFNWRLVLGPEHVLEYVVVHELVHLEISNHGLNFEERVDELFDQRQDAENWLNSNSAVLEFK